MAMGGLPGAVPEEGGQAITKPVDPRPGQALSIAMRAWQIGSFSWRWISRLMLPLWAVAAWAEGTNQLQPWRDYRTIMWIGDTAYKQPAKVPIFFQRLRELGINNAMVHGEIG